MSSAEQPVKTLQQVVDDLNRYPIEAFQFVQQGLTYSVDKIHGPATEATDAPVSRHITGQQLCEGIRDLAQLKWGMLARTVLNRWNLHGTIDFGRIIFAMVENGLMRKTDEDTIDDFRDVYDFKSVFDAGYRIPAATLEKSSEGCA